ENQASITAPIHAIPGSYLEAQGEQNQVLLH
ncbi:unnamed protein product, partial [Rotaria magnacalcarata]